MESFLLKLARTGARIVNLSTTKMFGNFADYYRSYLQLLTGIIGSSSTAEIPDRAAEKLKNYNDFSLDAAGRTQKPEYGVVVVAANCAAFGGFLPPPACCSCGSRNSSLLRSKTAQKIDKIGGFA